MTARLVLRERDVVTGFRYWDAMYSMSMDLSQETDQGLLLLMGAAGAAPEEQEIARAALRELHRRYYPYLLAVLEKYTENFGTAVIDPGEFAIATFNRAFRCADSFCDESDGDPARATAQVKAWLGVIATNLARDELNRMTRRRRDIELVPLEDVRDVAELDASADALDTSPTPPERLAALSQALDELKPEERDILMTYAAFGIPTESGRELPTEVRDALEARTGYERSNIRQKWRRLSQKLKAGLEPYVTDQKASNA